MRLTSQYALGDFAVRQAGIALNKSLDDIFKYGNRSMGFVNVWDPNVTSDGFTGFAQRRFAVRAWRSSKNGLELIFLSHQNGTFAFSDPVACSPLDTVGHSCARGTDNNVGFYECTSDSALHTSLLCPNIFCSIVLGVQLLRATFYGNRCRPDGREQHIHQPTVRRLSCFCTYS